MGPSCTEPLAAGRMSSGSFGQIRVTVQGAVLPVAMILKLCSLELPQPGGHPPVEDASLTGRFRCCPAALSGHNPLFAGWAQLAGQPTFEAYCLDGKRLRVRSGAGIEEVKPPRGADLAGGRRQHSWTVRAQ